MKLNVIKGLGGELKKKRKNCKKGKINGNNNAAYYTKTAVKKLHLDPRQGLKTKGVSVSSRRPSKDYDT